MLGSTWADNWLRSAPSATFASQCPPPTPAISARLGALRWRDRQARTASYRVVAGRVIAALWVAAIVYVVALSSLVARVVRGRGQGFAPRSFEQIVFLLIWGVATPAIIWSAERLPIERNRWLRRVLAHAAIADGVHRRDSTWSRPRSSGPYSAARHRSARSGAMGSSRAHRAWDTSRSSSTPSSSAPVTIFERSTFGVSEQLRAERLRADLASAQLRALTLQLQPHFLFNALNAVGALIITERNREAFEVVGRLGELLRALLAIERREEVSLREELELAEAYVGIEQARLGDRLRVSWDIAPDVAVRSCRRCCCSRWLRTRFATASRDRPPVAT